MDRRDHRLRTHVIAGVLGCGLLLSGCSGMAENAKSNDLCSQFDQLVKAADEFRAADPGQAKADDLRAQANHLRDSVNQVQAVADGQLDDVLSALEARLDDLRDELAAAGDEAKEAATAQWKEDVEAVLERWAIVRDRVATQCGSD